jgi:hypothetical protein
LFGQLPKLFDRNFAIGYFLPVTAFVVTSYGLLSGLGLASDLIPVLTENNALVNTTIIVIASWFFAVFLLVLNRPLYMMKEGYWVPPWIPDRWQGGKRRYSHLKDKDEVLADKIGKEKRRLKACGEVESDRLTHLRIERIPIALKLAEEFPDEAYLLPTRFGNIIRSFESYSRLVYGIDDIPGWSRLLAVIPKDYRDLVDGAKAQADFWLNMWFVGLLVILEYIVAVIGLSSFGNQQQDLRDLVWSWTIPYLIGSILIVVLASWQSGRAAIVWGDYVRASYDVFLPELGKKLGFPSVARDKQKALWVLFSNVILYKPPNRTGELLSQLSEPPAEVSADFDNMAMVQSRAKQLAVNPSNELKSQLASSTRAASAPQAEIERLVEERDRERKKRLEAQDEGQRLQGKLEAQRGKGLLGRLFRR